MTSFMVLVSDILAAAFTITMYEYEATIPTLWGHVMGSLSSSYEDPYVDVFADRFREGSS